MNVFFLSPSKCVVIVVIQVVDAAAETSFDEAARSDIALQLENITNECQVRLLTFCGIGFV